MGIMKKCLIIILIGSLFSFNDHYKTGDDGIINAQIKKPIKICLKIPRIFQTNFYGRILLKNI